MQNRQISGSVKYYSYWRNGKCKQFDQTNKSKLGVLIYKVTAKMINICIITTLKEEKKD